MRSSGMTPEQNREIRNNLHDGYRARLNEAEMELFDALCSEGKDKDDGAAVLLKTTKGNIRKRISELRPVLAEIALSLPLIASGHRLVAPLGSQTIEAEVNLRAA